MHQRDLVILKFGGSVLRDPADLPLIVHEIYRWWRRGHRVVAVVSAYAGTTDALLARAESTHERPTPFVRAAIAAGGEMQTATALAASLDQSGVPATLFSPGRVQMRATGPALDASPVSVSTVDLNRALDRHEVVVFPGFLAVDDESRTVTLGRGGSDLTALFLAWSLGARRCRLIKDVDGLYDADPSAVAASNLPRAQRYAHASYDDAEATDGTILQPKAIQFARLHTMSFEVGRIGGIRPTIIDHRPSVLADDVARETRVPRMRLAFAGAGTVGGGIIHHAARLPEWFDVARILVRDSGRERPELCGIASGAELLSTDPASLLAAQPDVLIETLGGLDPAASIVEAALAAGIHVITANKTLVAEHGPRLEAIGRATGARLLTSACVGGATPILERLAGRRVSSVRGVLNGTANFVLEALGRGASWSDAIATAQTSGLAEVDPSRDLDGRDSLDKLRLIARSIGLPDDATDVDAEHAGIDEALAPPPAIAARWRQVARVAAEHRSVTLQAIPPGDPLHSLDHEWNAVIVEDDSGRGFECVRGRGAGRWPTAESAFGDLLELHRQQQRGAAEARERSESIG